MDLAGIGIRISPIFSKGAFNKNKDERRVSE